MGKLGYAYVVIQASLSRFVISASLAPSLEIINSPLIGSGQVSSSSQPDPMIFSDMNTQSIAVNDTGNAELQVRCNGQKFGTPLDRQSCAGIIDTIEIYDKENAFAMRDYHGSEPINCGLPWRWLNPDGNCAVQLFLLAPASVAHASTTSIKAAAQAIYDKCGAGTPSKGGVATNIGGDNNLAVVLAATSYPNVRCEEGQVLNRRDCALLVTRMHATVTRQLFGPIQPGLPVPDVELPVIYHSPDSPCYGFVRSAEGPDYSSWYNLWEGASAVEEMCVKKLMNGEARGIGEAGHLSFALAHHANETETE